MQRRPCEICGAHLYVFFQMDAENDWWMDMHEKKEKKEKKEVEEEVEEEVQQWFRHYWNIHFNIDFHKRCICDYLIFLSLQQSGIPSHFIPVLRQN